MKKINVSKKLLATNEKSQRDYNRQSVYFNLTTQVVVVGTSMKNKIEIIVHFTTNINYYLIIMF